MSQRSIEILIGKLITDEAFRIAFLENATATLNAFAESGHELTAIEIAAITTVPGSFWILGAAEMDPRLQKISFASQTK